MRPSIAVGCALVLAAAAPAFAQDTFEPNPSLAQLTADDAYARTSAQSLLTAGIGASAIRIDDAGRVLVAGFGYYDGLRIARLDIDGRLDPTFGAAGVAEVPVSGIGPLGLEIDAAGRIVVAGFFQEAGTYPSGNPGYAGPVYLAARLLADGSLDSAFAADGLLEFDPATGVLFLGPVHASGGDGAMLALANKPNPTPEQTTGLPQPPFVGLVRIAADGTIDTAYGGGFAQISENSSIPPFFAISDDVQVADFAVDFAGRAVVPLQRSFGGGPLGVQRYDAAGAFDPSFWPARYASQIALDGEGRIVGLNDTEIRRLLPGGGTDPTFAGDVVVTRYEAAGFPGSFSVLAQILSYEQYDPNFDGSSFWGGTDFLAVATRADRWALARHADLRDAKGRPAQGIHVQTIDPSDPGAIVTTTYRFPDQSFGGLVGLAIAPDGTAAYALGDSFVLRVDLAKRKALPLPDLRVKWLGWPHAVDLGGGRYRVTAYVRITNASRTDAKSAYGFVGFAPGTDGVPPFPPGAYDIALVAGPNSAAAGYSWPFAVRARSSVVKRFMWEGGDASTDLAGTRLSIQIACELPDANPADNTATSRTITPVYAPR